MRSSFYHNPDDTLFMALTNQECSLLIRGLESLAKTATESDLQNLTALLGHFAECLHEQKSAA